MSKIIIQLEGEPLELRVPTGFEDPKMIRKLAIEELARRKAKDKGAVGAATTSALSTARKIYDVTLGKLEDKLGLLSDEDKVAGEVLQETQKLVRKEHPVASFVGGAAPYAALPASTIPRAIGSGALAGYAESGGETGGAALGGLTGGAVSMATRGLVRPGTPSAQAGRLMQENIQPTVGQAMAGKPNIGAKVISTVEEQLQRTLPLVGSSIQKARERAVNELRAATIRRAVPKGYAVPDLNKGGMRQVLAQLTDTYDDAYRSVYANRAFSLTPKDVSGLQRVIQNPEYLVGKEVRQQVVGHVQALLEPGRQGGRYSGEVVQRTLSEVRRRARELLRSGNDVERQTGRMYDAISRQIIRWRDRNLPPSLRDRAHGVDRAYANYKRLEHASTMLGAEEGNFTAAQLLNAVKTMDRKSQFGRGQALMQDIADPAKAVLQNKVPDSGTAGRAITGGLVGGGSMIEPTVAAGYLGGSGLAHLGSTRPMQKWMLGGYRWQAPALRILQPAAGRGAATLPYLFPEFYGNSR